MKPETFAAKRHLDKYRQALLRAISEAAARPLQAPSLFDPAKRYLDSWEEVGSLALFIWQMSALDSDRFDAHPQWEATANETIRFLSEHCAGCGRRLASPTARLCPTCSTTLDAPAQRALRAGEVARQIDAYLGELSDSLGEPSDSAEADPDDA